MKKLILTTSIVTMAALTGCTNNSATVTTNTPTPSPTMLPTAMESTSPSPTTKANQQNWKTYTTADYSIKYPSDWTATKSNQQVEIFNAKTMVEAAGNGGGKRTLKNEYVNIVEEASNKTVKQFVDNILATNPAFMNVSDDVLQRENIKINNISAEIMIDEGEAGSAKVIHISNGKKMFTLYTSALNIHDNAKSEVQIINSLTFK